VPELQTPMTGIVFGESPRWHDDRLWFSDWGAQELIAVDPESKSDVIVCMPSFPFCIDWLPDGRLLIVSARDRLLLRREPDGSLVTHAELSSFSDHPWNDIVTEYFHTVGVLREAKRVRPDFSVLSGWEDLILPSLLAGADGSICAFANVAPEVFIELVRSAQDGNLGKASELHRRVLSLLTLGAYSDPPIGAIKVAMRKLGVPISPAVRGPALPATDEQSIEAVLKEAGLLEISKTS
jgi:hypothetical protein